MNRWYQFPSPSIWTAMTRPMSNRMSVWSVTLISCQSGDAAASGNTELSTRQRNVQLCTNKISKTKKDHTYSASSKYGRMPVAGLEPAWISPHDFESCASANSATPAHLPGKENPARPVYHTIPLLFCQPENSVCSSVLRCLFHHHISIPVNCLFHPNFCSRYLI